MTSPYDSLPNTRRAIGAEMTRRKGGKRMARRGRRGRRKSHRK